MKLRIITLLAGVLVVAAAFTSKPEATGTLYIYRTGQFAGAAANWSIWVDGEKVCKLSNNKYIMTNVTPGKHTVSAKIGGVGLMKKETEVEIEVEGGSSYYVACNIKQSITRARLEMIEVTKGTAAKQMEKMELDGCQDKE